MKTFRFELSAHEEVDIKADNRNDAHKIAAAYWQSKFKGMFGEVEFTKEVKDK